MKRIAYVVILVLGILAALVACNPKTEDQSPSSDQTQNGNDMDSSKTNGEKDQDKDKGVGESTETENNIETEENDVEEEQEQQNEEISYEEINPNEIGSIMAVMYHGILDNPPYHRTAEDFKKDLTYMYENGYRPISIEDYLDNNIEVEAGLTPILLTFDDGLSTTFSLVENEEGELVPKEGTAVYIMEEFTKEHPDFGKAATFYINGDDAFQGDGIYAERLQWLINNGYSLGNHTATHAHLGNLTKEELQKEIARVDKMITDAVPNYKVRTLAYPFGERPLDYLDLVENGEYEEYSYTYEVAFRVGFSAPYVGPNHVNYQPFNHPRVTASEGYDWDLWYAFNYYNENPGEKYISDGKPNTITVPKSKEQHVKKETLGDKQLVVY